MTYQGFLVDGNGNPLATNNPANYPVIFRIYSVPSGGVSIWSEQQIVTVDKGNFSVVLGEGTPVSGENRPALSSVFAGLTASERYMGLSVTIGGSTPEILPRLRLLPAPYAFLATSANSVVQPNGSPVLNYVNDRVEVAGDLFTSGLITGNGFGLTNLQIPTNLTGNRSFSGNVGIGTTTPQTKLHLYGPVSRLRMESTRNDDWTTTEYQTDARIWHTGVGGSAVLNGINSKYYIGDFTAGQVRLVVDTSGNVGIGTTGPGAKLQIHSDNNHLRLTSAAGSDWTISPVISHATRGTGLVFSHPNFSGGIQGPDTWAAISRIGGTYSSSSDVRLKTDITQLGSVLHRVSKLRSVSYRFKSQTNSPLKSLGFIAQEVEPLFPEVVTEMNGFKGLSYSELIPVAISAIQELHDLVREKDSQLTALREKADRVDALEEELTALKKQVTANQQTTAKWEARFSALEKAVANVPGGELRAPGAIVGE